MEPPVREIEFEHRVLVPEEVESVTRRAKERGAGFMRNAKWVRTGLLIVAAVVIAFTTQRLGVSLPTAACVFVGVLPVLWLASSLLGLLWGSRRLIRSLQRDMAEAAAKTLVVTVRLASRDDGLHIDRMGTRTLVPWSRVEAKVEGGALLLTARPEHAPSESYLVNPAVPGLADFITSLAGRTSELPAAPANR